MVPSDWKPARGCRATGPLWGLLPNGRVAGGGTEKDETMPLKPEGADEGESEGLLGAKTTIAHSVNMIVSGHHDG